MSDTPRTDNILALIPGGQSCDPQAVADELREKMQELEHELAAATGERDALRLACARLDGDKEANARLCESLAAELATEQALADRLARSISRHDLDGGHTPQRQQRALAAWKEARP